MRSDRFKFLESVGHAIPHEPLSSVRVPSRAVTLGEILVTILDVQENFLLIGFTRAFVIRIKAYITVLGPMTGVATLIADIGCSCHDLCASNSDDTRSDARHVT